MIHDDLSTLLERINGAWALLSLVLLCYLLYYLYVENRAGQLTFERWRRCRTPLHVQAALAIAVFHLGDFGVRAIVWYLRHEINLGAPLSVQAPLLIPLALLSTLAGFGILCKLRVFSGPWLGPWVWIGGAFLGLAAGEFTRLLPLF